MSVKIRVKLTGTDGNIFALMGTVRRALIAHGQRAAATAMCAEVCRAGSYDEALGILSTYVEVC